MSRPLGFLKLAQERIISMLLSQVFHPEEGNKSTIDAYAQG